MPEYDAFGREIGEDPLERFKAQASAPAAPRPEPVIREADPEPAAPVAASEPAGAPPPVESVRPRRTRRRGGLARLVVIFAVLGAALYAVGNVGVKVKGGIQDIVNEFPTTEPSPPSATGIRGDSLIRRKNFAEAVDALSRAGLGRPLTMRVAPDRIDATLIDEGRLHQVQITPGGQLNELASSDAAPGRTIPYTAIDVSAPERLVRAGATKTVPARRIDYLVITAGPPVSWGAYYKGGRIAIGDAHGHKQRVL